MSQTNSTFSISDDGLIFPEIGPWAEEKYRLIAQYDELFSKGMKNKWDLRVYVDLYSGAGFGRVKETETRLMGSPLIALDVEYPFDRYIFCEQDPEKLDALRERVKRLAPSADVVYVDGSCDDRVDDILRAIPVGSASRKVLSLCLVDPYDFGLKFETLRRLSSKVFVDFLVLLAAHMDANRNLEHYFAEGNTKIDDAVGNGDWRARWTESRLLRSQFPKFLAEDPLLEDLGTVPLEGISWVIVGGESGPGARPMKEDWVLSIREQCKRAKVPFFFKQWGGTRKKEAGRMLLGRTFDEFPRRVRHRTLPLSLRMRYISDILSANLVQLRTG